MLVARSKPVYIGWLEATFLLSTYLRRRGHLYMSVLHKSYHGLVRGQGQGKSKPLPQLRLPERRLKVSPLHQRQVPSDLEQACHWRARLLIMYRERELLHGGKIGPRRDRISKSRGFKCLKIGERLESLTARPIFRYFFPRQSRIRFSVAVTEGYDIFLYSITAICN
jgi:hypothetical protein